MTVNPTLRIPKPDPLTYLEMDNNFQDLANAVNTLSGTVSGLSSSISLQFYTKLETDSLYVTKSGGSFTDSPIAPTPILSDSSTKLATTAYVVGQNYAKMSDLSSFVTTDTQQTITGNKSFTNLSLSSGTLFLNSTTEPSTPPSGFTLFLDSATNKLKLKDSFGTVTNISSAASPNTVTININSQVLNASDVVNLELPISYTRFYGVSVVTSGIPVAGGLKVEFFGNKTSGLFNTLMYQSAFTPALLSDTAQAWYYRDFEQAGTFKIRLTNTGSTVGTFSVVVTMEPF
jgi:hypothetical protein